MERRQRLMDHQQLEAEMARVKAEAERGVAAQAAGPARNAARQTWANSA